MAPGIGELTLEEAARALREGVVVIECRVDQVDDIILLSGLARHAVEDEVVPLHVPEFAKDAAHLLKRRVRLWRAGSKAAQTMNRIRLRRAERRRAAAR